MMRGALLLLGVVPALGLAACTSAGGSPLAQAAAVSVEVPVAAVETVTADELAGMIARGEVVLVDVRTPGEFGSGRLAGSLNAPVETFDPASIPMEAGRETILYCRSSGRSGRAAEMLAEYTGGTVRHLEGGILAWEAAGQPVIAASGSE